MPEPLTVAIDAMGGDHAPTAIVEGGLAAVEQHGGTTNSTLRSLGNMKANLNDPEKIKLMECMGVKIYMDPQPRAYQESCVRGHTEARFGLGETHDHTERTD